ncbi:MAG: glycosyltransferase [Planctomycetota bacterium]|jgi:glycosyltransferase involved in cell wall biosynthesis
MAQPETIESAKKTERVCDGVVCFGGEDWWYHNRGHFDMQMMRELSREVPVLYVNSLGMRVPRVGEGSMFVRRVLRKLRSMARGFVRVRETFGVCSPISFPGTVGMRISRRLLPGQVRRCARRMGITKPLVWVACPPGASVVTDLHPVGLVYQRTDRYEDYENVDVRQIVAYDQTLKRRADITVFCARVLHADERDECKETIFIDHGVDYERFASAGDRFEEPADVAEIDHPRVGFVGGIDASTFDPELFVEVARRLPDVNFVMVGACSLPEGWCEFPNVYFLGQKPYEQVADYMASCVALLMPWNRSDWIQACNPVKLKEYLAIGRPIVSTSFPELDHYRGLIRVADGGEAFASAILEAIRRPDDPLPQRERVEHETWGAKGEQMVARLSELGIELQQGADV